MSEVKRYHFEAFIDNYYKHYQFIRLFGISCVNLNPSI